MTNQHIKRIGFACKWAELSVDKEITSVPELNTGGTTITWLNKQKQDIAEQKLWNIIEQNTTSTFNLVKRVSTLNPGQRMVRISSDMLTAYTHDNWSYFYKKHDVIAKLETAFAKIGDFARANDVRLSMHPGQFVVLASENPGIVDRSIDEFEYHANMARWMGYGKSFQDFKINVHISGKAGPDGIRASYKRLTPEARNCITIENEENSWGLTDCLTLSDLLPIVLDIHHHFIREGEYIQASDDRIKQVIDSWKGVRPTFHYSQSREDILINHPADSSPVMQDLLANGYKKQKLRAHSDFMWNESNNDWARNHWSWGDCMVEAKAKNLASFKLYNNWII